MSSSPKTRPREADVSDEPDAKRTRLEGSEDAAGDVTMSTDSAVAVVNIADLEEQENMDVDEKEEGLLPPSHALLDTRPPVYGPDGSMQQIMETDVGISEYIGFDVPKIEGIIKQRCVVSRTLPTLLLDAKYAHS